MSLKGKIYGLVGVIGSGKSYQAEALMVGAACEERPMIIGDFSEGIRQTLMNIFTGESKGIDCTGAAYAKWKQLSSDILLPFFAQADSPNILDSVRIEGRELLQHTGEYLKSLAGEDVWARWTANAVTNSLAKMSEEDALMCDIVFGSLRFDCEAEAIFKVAEATGKEVQIYFCDYHSDSYELNDHISEKFAQYFLSLGCKDGDDITELVKQKING
jgi:hypothetical protein